MHSLNCPGRIAQKWRCYIAAIFICTIVVALWAKERSERVTPKAAVASDPFKLPPLPPGVTELKFGDFFQFPVGPLGLTMTDKLRRLDGKQVRMLGYMVHNEQAPVGKFLFTAMPVQIHDHDPALADDLPPATVCVCVPICREKQVPYTPGLMLLTGTLSVGPQEEPDGRICLARLALDAPAAPSSSSHRNGLAAR